jgi:Ribosomal L38e protein family
MPRRVTTSEQFEELLPKATECRVLHGTDSVKLKLRTPTYLYTYVTNEDVAEDLLKRLKDIEIVDYTPVSKKKEKKAPSETEEKKKSKKKSPKKEKEEETEETKEEE